VKRPYKPGYVSAERCEEFIHNLQEELDSFVAEAYSDFDAEETDRDDTLEPLGEDSREGDTAAPPFGPLKPPPSLAKTSKKVSV